MNTRYMIHKPEERRTEATGRGREDRPAGLRTILGDAA